MKITKKIGDEYYTFEDDEIDKVCPSSFKEACIMTVVGMIMFFVALGLIQLLGFLLETFFPSR